MTFGEEWGWGSSVAGLGGDPRALPRARRQLHRHRQRLHEGPLRGDHRRPPRPRSRQARPRRHRHEVLRPTCSRAIRTAAARAARRSSPRAKSRCVACRPTTSISTGCTPGTRHTPIEETMRALDDLVEQARFATSAFRTRRPGRSRRRRRWRCSAAGRRSSALQIEYSLLERTVEGELDPDGAGARPRRHAVVAAAGRRAQRQVHARQAASRSRTAASASRRFSTSARSRILDELMRIAARAGTRPPPSRSRGCRSRPGVTSTIIGARTIEQLEENLAALDLTLPERRRRARRALEPTLNFPATFLQDPHVRARRRDGERRAVGALAAHAQDRRGTVLAVHGFRGFHGCERRPARASRASAGRTIEITSRFSLICGL